MLMLSRLKGNAQLITRTASVRAIGNRSFCSGIHDDFKPQKRAYSPDEDVHVQITKDIAANKVTVFMKGVPEAPMCGFSNTVVQIMKVEGVQFKGINVLADPDLREGIKTFSNWPTIPQVYVGGEFIGGCDTTLEMYKSGELRALLKEAGAK